MCQLQWYSCLFGVKYDCLYYNIPGIGIDQKTNLFADWEVKLIRDLVNYVDELTVETKRELNEELSKCSRAEEHKYQIEMDRVVDKYSNEFTVSRESRILYGRTPFVRGIGWVLY